MIEEELINKAYEMGVKVYPTSTVWAYTKSHDCGAVLLGFGAMQLDNIPLAVKLLREAWLTKYKQFQF